MIPSLRFLEIWYVLAVFNISVEITGSVRIRDHSRSFLQSLVSFRSCYGKIILTNVIVLGINYQIKQ